MHLCADCTNQDGLQWSAEDYSSVRGEIVLRVGLVRCSPAATRRLVVDLPGAFPDCRATGGGSSCAPAHFAHLGVPDAQVGLSLCDDTVRCCRIRLLRYQGRRPGLPAAPLPAARPLALGPVNLLHRRAAWACHGARMRAIWGLAACRGDVNLNKSNLILHDRSHWLQRC
jgi:hypothetical protein